LINKDFLKGSMVDLGESAEPTFCDYNADGLLDIVIGTSGNFILTSEREPSLILFKNIGTAESPEYVLEDDNYLNFNEFKTTSTFLAPAFGDLDGDGDQDLLVGDNVGKLYYAENIAGEGEPFEFDNPSYEYQDIRVSGYLRPTIFDLNDDGLGDIIAGERNFNSTDEVPIASINYFENQGSIGVPSFDPNVNTFPNNPALGGINLKQQNSISNNSSISVWNDEKDILFFTGSESGDVRLFSLPKDSSIHSIYTEVFDYELDQIDVGEESSVKVNDLNGDNELEILVGNYRGGIGIFNTLTPIIANTIVDNTEEVILGKSFQIFPNPTYDIIQIRSEELTFDRAEIYDISGRKRLMSNTEMMNLSNLESGSYIVRLYTAKGLAVKKITKL